MGCGTGVCVVADSDESDLSGRLSRGELRQCPVRRGLQQWYERPSLSRRKRQARIGAAKCAKRWGCCNAARKVHRLPQWTDKSSRHPSLPGSDRASRRTLIALRENHHASGVALKVPATWAAAVNDSDPCANCYTHSKIPSSAAARSGQVVATVATYVAMLQTPFCMGCRRCRRCRHSPATAHDKAPL
jgi:hypothetical protein